MNEEQQVQELAKVMRAFHSLLHAAKVASHVLECSQASYTVGLLRDAIQEAEDATSMGKRQVQAEETQRRDEQNGGSVRGAANASRASG